MSAAKWPFRTEVRSLSPQQLGRLNAERRNQGLSAYPPAEEVLRQMEPLWREGGVGLTEALRKWGMHPDERVSLALLEHPNLVMAEVTLPARFYERALDERRKTGVVWTPLLDRLESSRNWPEADKLLDSGTPAARTVTPVRAHRLAAELTTWVEAQRETAPLLELASFRSYFVLTLIAQRASVLDEPLLQVLGKEPGAWASLIARPLPEALSPVVWRVGMNLVGEGPERPGFFNGLQTFRAMEERGHPMPREVALALLEQIRESLALSGASPSGVDNLQRAFQFHLVERGDWEDEEMEVLYQFAARARALSIRSERWRALARSPSARADHWLRLLVTSPGSRLREEIARIPAALREERVREVLGRSRNPQVLGALLPGSSPEEFRERFPRVAEAEPLLAARALQGASSAQLALLERAWLAPLLSSPKAEVRVAAIRALGLMPEHVPPTPARHRRGRGRGRPT